MEANRPISAQESKALASFLGARGAVKVIPVEGDQRRVIVRTDVLGAEEIRDVVTSYTSSSLHLRTVLTSGNIGKLKKRARDGTATEAWPSS
ncbi:MAG TPA: hypothetical protein VEJ36_07655 [Nitrososphaerales archaeon]|nr:hypothetical protein [Nitrososphaerales archaeon]